MENRLNKYIDKTDTCWLWTGGKSRGYGRFWDGSSQRQAHAVTYELRYGVIPEDLELDHLCFVRDCVNPDHLEPVTHLENIHRASVKRLATPNYCKQGHKLEWQKNGSRRRCNECRRVLQRELYRDKVYGTKD